MANIIESSIEQYAEEHSGAETASLVAVAAETRASSAQAQMMVGRLEGRFLRTLARLVRARRILEIGTFTGYSALSMVEVLPADGRLITCELDPDRAATARRHFDEAGVGDRIEIRLGQALESVRTLEGPFDLVFIDADKASYPDYYEASLPLLAPTGVMVVDNVLWSGRVLDPDDQSQETRTLVAFNDFVAADPRVDCVMLPVRDGVTLITHRPSAGSSAAGEEPVA